MPSELGPDVVIAGAARSGTSSLASELGRHPAIDPGSVKESNYFSRRFDRGPAWYDGLYQRRLDGLLRLDASVSYTSPLYPDALARLAQAAPDVFVVYVVRDPVRRALSHYLYRHVYFQIEPAADFATALRTSTYYTDSSDYSRWLTALTATFSRSRLLVVPFEAVTSKSNDVVSEVCRHLQVPAPSSTDPHVRKHRNDVVEFRTGAARHVSSVLRSSNLYPKLRAAIGPSRMRRLPPNPDPASHAAQPGPGARHLRRDTAGAAERSAGPHS